MSEKSKEIIDINGTAYTFRILNPR